ncbi:hypothetical protein ACIRG4_18945 [Streptomyces sp. NPDC102395]|uniref:hypothetical protein n=1 Tax=Streptomyces sp. NPDC102395 TaxID=3366168 RepID=UPI0037F850FD
MSVGGRETGTVYRVLLFVLSAIFVSLCTVVGGALAPSVWPPESWVASAGAVFLIALAFAAGVVMPVFFKEIPPSIERRPLRELVKNAWKEQTFSATTVAVLLAVVALIVWLSTPATGLSRLVKDDRVGGMDLTGYCQSYGFKDNTEEACYSPMVMDEVCNWRYEETGLHFVTSGNRVDGKCFTSAKVLRGGIWDMSDYCLKRFGRRLGVDAVAARNNWECQMKIDKNLACDWFWAKRDLEARKDGADWGCYQ